MGLLIQTQRWADRKPLGPQEIDWAHPLTRGLRFFLLMGERAGPPRDLVSGAFLGSNFDWLLDDEGVGINQAATIEATTPFVPTAFPFTINARWRPYFASTVLSSEDAGFVSSSTARKITFSGKNKAADTNEYRLFLGGTEAVLPHSNADPVSGLVVVDTTGISRASNDHLFYWGQDAPITSTTDAGTNLSLNRFRIRGAAVSSTWYHFGCWDRALTADEVAWLHAEPYVLLRPRRRRLFIVGAAATSPIAGSVPITVTPSASLGVRGALVGTGSLLLAPSATLSGKGTLAGAAAATVTPSATLSAIGRLIASSQIVITPSATIGGAGALAGTLPIVVTPGGTLTGIGSGAIAGSIPITVTPAGTLTARGALTGALPVTISPAGTLKGLGALNGAAAVAVAATGTIKGRGALSGTTAIAVVPTAVLQGVGSLIGGAQITLLPTGRLLDAGARNVFGASLSDAAIGAAVISQTVTLGAVPADAALGAALIGDKKAG